MADHTLSVSAWAGGSVSPSGAVIVPDGGSQAFTATPNANHEVDLWKLDGATAQDGGNGYSINGVVADHTIVVNFASILSFDLASDAVIVAPKTFTLKSDAYIVAPKQIGKPITLLPFEGAGWKYLKTDSLPVGWSDAGFDDSAWTDGQAAFGDSLTDCVPPETIHTAWGKVDPTTFLLIRTHFSVALATTVDPTVLNALTGVIYEQFLNGTLIDLAKDTNNCPTLGNIVSFPPISDFVDGDNVIAVALTRPGPHDPELSRSFYDVSIVAKNPLTSDAYIVGGKTVILLSDAVILSPAVDFTLTSDAVIRRPPLPPGQQNLLGKYLEEQRAALLAKNCTTCAPIDCLATEAAYSLESAVYPIVLSCPPGVDCSLIGDEFHLICCDGTAFNIYFSPEVTQADRQTIANQAITDCARKLPFCTDCPNPPCDPCPTPPCNGIWLYWNHAASCTVDCPSGGTFTAWQPAHTILAFSQLLADQAASRAACARARDHRLCIFDLESVICVGSEYSDDVVVSGRYLAAYPDADTIEISSGALPDGLVLNSGSSFFQGGRCKLEGTPTLAGIYTFTIRVTLGSFGTAFGDYQERSFTITVSGISPTTLPDAKIGTAYLQNLTVSPAHDQETEVWKVTTSLPAGLELTSFGVIHGTPTGPAESHHVVVQCCFELDHEPICCTREYTLTVNEGCTQQTVVSYQATGWKYLQIGVDEVPPANYEKVAFDDSGWSTGQGAFGEGPDIGTPCPLISTVHTAWTRDTRLVLRKHITLSAGTKSVRLRFSVDNDVLAIWFNGVLLGSDLHHDFCPTLPNFEKLAADGSIIVGTNVVAVLCRDHYLTPPPNGDQSFFDLTVVACVP